MKIIASCYLLIFLFCITGCTKETDETAKEILDNCVLTKISQQGDTTALSTNYIYAGNGLPAKIKGTNFEINFSYSVNKVLLQEGGITREYTLGNDSLAQYSITRFGSDTDSSVYFYNQDKYQIKSIRFFNGVKKDSIGYVIANGNVISMKFYNEYGYVNYFRDFTYHSNIETKYWMYTKLGGDYGYFYYPWLGKPNKNLLKSTAQYGVLDSYDYQFDIGGKIEKISVTNYGLPTVITSLNLSYSCN